MTSKQMISIRFDKELLALIDAASNRPQTKHYGHTRTRIIETAVRQHLDYIVVEPEVSDNGS